MANQCSPSAESHRFKNLGNELVTDTKTRLTWMRCSFGMRWEKGNCVDAPRRESWLGAKQMVIHFNHDGGIGGFRDWRLPTLEELASLVESQCYDPAIDQSIFPNTPNIGFWSSTPDKHYLQGAWLVYFLNGGQYMGNKEYEWAIRIVR